MKLLPDALAVLQAFNARPVGLTPSAVPTPVRQVGDVEQEPLRSRGSDPYVVDPNSIPGFVMPKTIRDAHVTLQDAILEATDLLRTVRQRSSAKEIGATAALRGGVGGGVHSAEPRERGTEMSTMGRDGEVRNMMPIASH